MFQKARFKLTAWYLAIIMAISILFSFVIYSGIDVEFRRFERMQERIKELQDQRMPFRSTPILLNTSRFDPEMISNARTRVITILGIINLSILGIAGVSGYFLAGRTLKPIKKMVEEQNRFIADASHELRTPLTSLRSEIEVNLRKKDLTLKDSKKLLESNLEEVVSLQTLSDNLLELAQTEKPSNTSTFVQVSIKDCINNAIGKLDRSIKEKQIRIEYKRHPELGSGSDSGQARMTDDVLVSGIPDRITELFVILIDNAIKYSPAKSKIIISARKQDGMVEIKVKDNGIGIEETDLLFIFDRFYRASKSRSKDHVPGYGLGLSIAKKIIEIHNGTITVESKVNKGTTFSVIFKISNL